MKKVLLSTVVLLLIVLFLGGCESPPTYSITGKVTDIECNDGRSFRSSYITLDNNVTYYSDGVIGCKLSEGVKVNIVHNADLGIKELIVDGTIKSDTNKDSKQ